MNELIDIFLKYVKNKYFRAIGIVFFLLVAAMLSIGQHNLNEVNGRPNDPKLFE